MKIKTTSDPRTPGCCAAKMLRSRNGRRERAIIGLVQRQRPKVAKRRDALISQKTRTLVKKFGRLFPNLEMEVAHAWAGTFGETEDGLAYIGVISGFRIVLSRLAMAGTASPTASSPPRSSGINSSASPVATRGYSVSVGSRPTVFGPNEWIISRRRNRLSGKNVVQSGIWNG